TRAKFGQRRKTAVDRGRTRGWLENTGANLQQRTLPAAIFPHDAESLAGTDLKSNITKRPIILVKAAALKRVEFIETIAGRGVDRVALGDPREFDSRGKQY